METDSLTVSTDDKPRTPGLLGRLLPVLAVLGAVAAGGAAWGLGEATHELFQPSKEAASHPYAFKQMNAEKDVADGLNAAIAFGSLGGLVGLVLGVLAGVGRGSLRGAMAAGLLGLVLGAVAGALPCPFVVPQYRRHFTPEAPSLLLPVLVHGASWCALGAAAGLAYGVGLGNRRRVVPALLGGLLGGLLGTVAYDALGAILFPHAQADLPIATEAPARLLARLLVAASVALGAVMFARSTPRHGA